MGFFEGFFGGTNKQEIVPEIDPRVKEIDSLYKELENAGPSDREGQEQINRSIDTLITALTEEGVDYESQLKELRGDAKSEDEGDMSEAA